MTVMAACCAMVSCEQNGNENGSSGTPDGCPVTYVRLPSRSVYSGDRVQVIGSGFSSEAGIYLVSCSDPDVSIQATDVLVTASGIEMTVNADEGEYMLVLEQDGRWELGIISIAVRKPDVSISGFPDYCLPGGTFTVSGTGFNSSSAISVEASGSGIRTALPSRFTSGKLTVTVPQDGPRGRLRLILSQDNTEMLLSDRFFITEKKTLTGLKYSLGGGLAGEQIWEISVTRDAAGNITGCEPYSFETEDSPDGTVRYIFTASAEDEENGYQDFSFDIDPATREIVSVTFGNSEDGSADTFTWDYADGYLSFIVTPKNTGAMEVSQDGNITLEDFWIACDYGDLTLVNNPFAADFTLCALATSDLILQAAMMTGCTGEASANLPESFGSDPVTYIYDNDGYVIRAEYTDPLDSYDTVVEFTYE